MNEVLGRIIHKHTKLPTQTVDVNTTCDFGFLQPMCGCFPLIPKSTLKLRHRSFTRFHQMGFPTFGRCEQRTYHYFVPIADIYHPFESLLAGKPFNGSGRMYVPTQVFTAPQSLLSLLCHSYSDCTAYAISNLTTDSFDLGVSYTPTAVQCANALYRYFGFDIPSVASDPLYSFVRTNIRVTQGLSTDEITPSSADLNVPVPVEGSNYIFCFRFNQRGQNLRKVLIGLGYQLNRLPETVTLLPLVAYLKVYFDYWYPDRHMTWKQTNTYHMMECIEQSNLSYSNLLEETSFGFFAFIQELTECYYYQNTDYYTAQTGTIAIADATSTIGIPDYRGVVNTDGSVGNHSQSQQAHLRVGNTTYGGSVQINSASWAQLKALEFISKFINKNTAIGGKIDKYLQVHYGADYIQRDHSYFIGVDVNQVQISDVMSTSDTATTDASGNPVGAGLGEFAGKGIGYSEGKQFTFKADTFGYYINMSVVVPLTRFNQGVDPNLKHKTRFDFYLGAADGLTLLPTSKSSLFGIGLSGVTADGAFGYAPIYSEYKSRPLNILNGNFSRNNYRYMRGYMLDKMFNDDEYVLTGQNHYNIITDGTKIFNELSPSIELRTIGKHGDYENYDRIFVNRPERSVDSDGYNIGKDDNIISHNVFEYDVIAPVLPYGESFDTDSFKDGLKVEKA